MRLRHWPFTHWEDWWNGMYERRLDQSYVAQAVDLLSDPPGLLAAMSAVTLAWPCATETVIAGGTGRHSWLGHAACRFTVGAVRDETCRAWGMLTENARNEANGVAASVIHHWLMDRATGGGWHA